jgi:alkylation response protein AidB-like acyl-CoA dehydrogenase
MGPEEHGGHCELEFDGLEINDENRLLEVGDGLRLTQIRLGPARPHHCMRWTGLGPARRWRSPCARIENRWPFGAKLADKESVQQMVGQAAMELDIAGCSPCAPPGCWTRAAWRGRRSPWRRSSWRMRCTGVDTSLQLLGRARLLEGHAGGVDVPLRPPGPAGGRGERGAPHGAGEFPAPPGQGLLRVGRLGKG